MVKAPSIGPPSEARVTTSPEAILEFWFGRSAVEPAELAARVPRWFGGDRQLDEDIRKRFSELPERALAGEFDAWRDDPRSAVALILVLDQFPRNLRRGDAGAFACDARALDVTLAWMDAGHDQVVEPVLAAFGYMPLEHAEDLPMQERCVASYEALASRAGEASREQFEGFCGYSRSHRDIIKRFGRFPHRNAVLGREPTEDERAWLEAGGETFGG